MKKRRRCNFFGQKSTFFGMGSSAGYVPTPMPVAAKIKGLFNRMFFNRQG